MKKLTAIVIGAGGRGRIYTRIMRELEGKFELVGIAEPILESVNYELSQFPDVPKENIYDTWEKILDRPKFADFAIIATQDHMHTEPALKAIELGYDILIEKPIAPTPEECKKIAEAAKAKGVKVLVCHVLRYAPKFAILKELIESGKIGEVMSIQALESVGNRHMAHSFVRGAWGNSDTSCPMILTKCCHDTDIIQWLMGKKCTRVHSFGNLSFFNKEHQPEGAPSRCTEECPHREECIYDIKKMYIENQYMGSAWFKDAAAGFAGDASGRCMKIFGTKGTLEIRGDAKFIYYTKFGQRIEDQWGDRVSEEIDIARPEDANGIGLQSGHGSGDAGLMQALYEYFTDTYTGNAASTAEVSYLNHLISFGAEESRVTGTVIDIAQYSERL